MLSVFVVSGVLGALALTDVRADELREMHMSANSHGNLRAIGMLLLRGARPLEEVLRSAEGTSEEPRIVSAEKVLTRAAVGADLEDYLVCRWYEEEVPPTRENAKKPTERWGSSYLTWAMSSRKWRLAKDFWWNPEEEGTSRGQAFPIMWEKMPYAKAVRFLDIRGGAYSLSAKNFDSFRTAAERWVNPKAVGPDQVAEVLESKEPRKIVEGVRLLGATERAEYVPVIEKCLAHADPDVRRAAVWALGTIGESRSILVLKKTLADRDFFVRFETAVALGKIGGDEPVAPLSALMKDPRPRVRQQAAKALGLTKSAKAVPPLYMALGDEDQQTRQIALEALRQLGWRPEEQPPK